MCTLEKRGNVFILTLTGDDEHRLNPTLIDSIRAAIRRAREEAVGPSVLITTSHGKFFSNGYDLAWASSDTSRLDHDYLLMRNDRGFLYMSELDKGMEIPAWFVALLKTKAASPRAWREVVLKAAKLTASMGMEVGVVDSAHDSPEETVKAAVELGEKLVARGWDGRVYAHCRRTVYSNVLVSLGSDLVTRSRL
nr:enoyl-CoA delta isomerase 1, peroxisomal-like [Ipomoea batatas]